MEQRCSRCKIIRPSKDYGLKNDGERYKTCVRCRDRSSKIFVQSTNAYEENKPFLKIDDVVETSKLYGYEVLVIDSDPSNNCGVFSDMYIGEHIPYFIERKVQTSKTMFIIHYEHPFSKLHNMILRSISDSMIEGALVDDIPCVICIWGHKKGSMALSLVNNNGLKHFVNVSKLKHARRCSICLETEKKFAYCFCCNNRTCLKCFQKLPNMICPFCNYDIYKHIEHMADLYCCG